MAKSATARASRKRKPAKAAKERSHLRVVTDEAVSRPRWREFAGVGLLALGILIGLALFSYHPAVEAWPSGEGAQNLIGPVGALLAELLLAAVGVGAYLFAGSLILFGVFCFTPRRIQVGSVQIVGLAIALLGASTIAHITLSSVADIAYPPGGLLGAIAGDGLGRFLAPLGTAVLAGAVTAVGLLLLTDMSITSLVGATGDGCARLGELAVDLVKTQRERMRVRAQQRLERRAAALERTREAEEAKRQAAEEKEARRQQRQEEIKAKAEALAAADLIKEEARAALEAEKAEAAAQAEAEAAEQAAAEQAAAEQAQAEESEAIEPLITTQADEESAASAAVADERATAEAPEPNRPPAPGPLDRAPLADPAWVAELEAHDTIPGCEAEELAAAESVLADSALDVDAPSEDAGSPRIIEYTPRSKREQKKLVEGAKDERPRPYGDAFELPPLNLLDYDAPEVEPVDKEALNEEARKLVKKFKDYGIEGHVREIRPGPVVTTFEFVPAAGTRIARIASLADDIAMAMEAMQVRVVAPIPGKGAVGIEIPNKKTQSVYLKEIIASAGFQRSASKLSLALGKDIEGRPYHVDLAKMPHMLIAGTTGSGKSVAINAMITSILYKATPEEVRFLMIDPKMLELAIYEGIPHLLLPPVTDPKKAAVALRWAVDEMERRYQVMSEHGVRDIVAFNRRADKLKDAAASPPPAPAEDKKKKVFIRDERDSIIAAAEQAPEPEQDDDAVPVEVVDPSKIPDRLPYIVVVLDEFADLMQVASRDVESYVSRLAQKARACGIHLLLATQRPSTDVITGVIKANFPVRMSFRVASNHDSKTIINGYGAEKLLGKGDMLVIPPGTSTLLRCHGAFITDVEIKRLVDFLKSQGAPSYDENILKAGEEERAAGEEGEEEYDEHFDAAAAIVAETRQVSISMIQRRLKIGYNRAARIVERMERDGMVGPQLPGNKPREVFLQPLLD